MSGPVEGQQSEGGAHRQRQRKKGGETQWEMKREKKDTKLTYKGNERQRVRDTEIQRGTGEMTERLRLRGGGGRLPQRIWVPFPISNGSL